MKLLLIALGVVAFIVTAFFVVVGAFIFLTDNPPPKEY